VEGKTNRKIKIIDNRLKKKQIEGVHAGVKLGEQFVNRGLVG